MMIQTSRAQFLEHKLGWTVVMAFDEEGLGPDSLWSASQSHEYW